MQNESNRDRGGGPHLCSYAPSKLSFRGPAARLDQGYVACLGGAETFGKFVSRPFPNLLSRALPCGVVNLGCVNAGVDAFLKDTTVMHICQRARAVVIQASSAHNMSNRFYTVHPRRNDRFLRAALPLRQLYPDVDFAEFHFTRHLLGHLWQLDPKRFALLCGEIRCAWVARMRTLIQGVQQPVILLWLEGAEDTGEGPPPFISAPMITTLRGDVVETVVLPPTTCGGGNDMTLNPSEAKIAARMMNPDAHKRAAAALLPPLNRLLHAPPLAARVREHSA